MKIIFDDEEVETKAKKYMEDWELEWERDVRRVQNFNEFFEDFDLEECLQICLNDFDGDIAMELSESQKNDIYGIYVAKAKKVIEEESKIDNFIEDCAKAMLTYANKYGLKNLFGENFTIGDFKDNVSDFVENRCDY